MSRFLFPLLILGVILAVPAAVVGYRFYTSRPSYLTEKGAEALERGDFATAKQFADRLQSQGADSAAHLLRGKISLYQAKAIAEQASLPVRYEGLQRASQLIISSAGLASLPIELRGPNWLSLIQVQKSFRRPIFGIDEFLDALREFAQVLDGDPWASEATILASECLYHLGDYRSAEQALTTLVGRQPDNLDAHRWLAAIYVEVSVGPPAATHLREWIRLDPKDPRPFGRLALITRYSDAGPAAAIPIYRDMLRLGLNPNERAAVLQEIAQIQIAKLADYQQALETLAEIPNDFQDRLSFRLLRADCLLGLGKREEAQGLVDDILSEQPSATGALLFRGRLHMQAEQPELAIPLFQKVVSLHPNNPRGRQNLMLAYRTIHDDRHAAEQKEFLDALLASRPRLRELQKIVDNEPWNGQVRLEMALLNASTNYPDALDWIHSALAATPDDPRIRDTWTQLVGFQPPPLLRDYQRRRHGKTETGSFVLGH